MERGTVVLDSDQRMWLCVKAYDDPILGPGEALMHCEDQRIERPNRVLRNIMGPVTILSVPKVD